MLRFRRLRQDSRLVVRTQFLSKASHSIAQGMKSQASLHFSFHQFAVLRRSTHNEEA
jgi:hypothetical protein